MCGEQCRHQANTIERSVLGGNEGCATITAATCSFLPRDALLSAVYAVVVCLSVCVCVCVCLSVTLRYCIKTAKRRITQTTPHEGPMTLVF